MSPQRVEAHRQHELLHLDLENALRMILYDMAFMMIRH